MTLHSLVLHKLSEQPLSGYSLAKEIKRSTGQQPSYGSIYPLLERMAGDGLVTMQVHGRSKIYTITGKGREAVASLKCEYSSLLDQMISQSRMFGEITGTDSTPMISMLEQLKAGNDPLAGISVNAIYMRDLLFRMAHQGKIKRNQKEINAILADTIKRLEKLK